MIKKLFLVIFLLTISALATPAQMNPEQALLKARDQFSDIKNRSVELERMKRETSKRPTSQHLTLNFPEIKKDFEKIQKLNSDILQLTAAKTPPDYAAVTKFVSEINHRAARLRSNLFPSEPKQKNEAKNKQQTDFESKDIKTLLGVMDKFINSFVHSSIFQNVKLVNSADSIKAQKDLESVINVSYAIKAKTKN